MQLLCTSLQMQHTMHRHNVGKLTCRSSVHEIGQDDIQAGMFNLHVVHHHSTSQTSPNCSNISGQHSSTPPQPPLLGCHPLQGVTGVAMMLQTSPHAQSKGHPVMLVCCCVWLLLLLALPLLDKDWAAVLEWRAAAVTLLRACHGVLHGVRLAGELLP